MESRWRSIFNYKCGSYNIFLFILLFGLFTMRILSGNISHQEYLKKSLVNIHFKLSVSELNESRDDVLLSVSRI
jgi:hypothetical protein